MSLSNQLYVASCQGTACQRGSKSKQSGLEVASEMKLKATAAQSFLPESGKTWCAV